MRLRPLLLAALLSAAAGALHAQGITRPAVLYARPGSGELATVARGTVLDAGEVSGQYTLVHLHGFIATSLLGGQRDSFPVSVAVSGARLRAGPSTSNAVVAELREGMALHAVGRTGTWTEVDRAGWVQRGIFPRAAASSPDAAASTGKGASSATPDPPAAGRRLATASAPDSSQGAPPAGAMTPSTTAGLSPAPGVAPVAQVQNGAALIPLARDRGWVRVRLEGWVREGDLVAGDSTLETLTAADLRVNPARYAGRLVRWKVVALAFQTADPLRKDMRPNEPYLLARGPGAENALMYLALPPGLVDKARGLGPMTPIVVTARIRTGRADPSGVPILDVQSLTTR
jgi:hypothetical protein